MVRRLDTTEWMLFRDVRLRALRTDPTAFESTAEQEVSFGEADWIARIGRRAVGFIDDHPIGMVGWAWGPEPTARAELIGMWVDPQCRGSGAADALVDYVKAIVGEQGRELELAVRADNPRAIRFYERCGFVVIGRSIGRWSGAALLTMKSA